jgi:hypothetical protein
LQRSSSDERLALLLKICNIKKLQRNDDKDGLRDVSAVTGGDPDHPASFRITVKTWLDDFRRSLGKVAMSSGFRSTGLTAALTHTSFIGVSGAVENGIVFDDLIDFNDPTGVLSGPIEVITGCVQQLTMVSGASVKSKIRAANQSRSSALENELRAAKLGTKRISLGEVKLTARDITRAEAINAAAKDFTIVCNERIDTSVGSRTTYVGPRLVYTGIKDTHNMEIDVSGGLTHFGVANGNSNDTHLVSSRYILLGKKRQGTVVGSLGGFLFMPSEKTSLTNAPTDVTTCRINDDTLKAMQAGPLKLNIGTTNTDGPKEFATDPTYNKELNMRCLPGCNGSGECYGLEAASCVLIPLSGLDDTTAGIHGMSEDEDVSTISAAIAPASAVQVTGSSIEKNGVRSHINVSRYMRLAKKYNNVDFDTIMVFDLTSVLKHDGAVPGTPTNIQTIHSHMIEGHATVDVDVSNLYSIVSSEDMDADVKYLRDVWSDSDIVKLTRGYDRYALSVGDDPVVDRAFSELVASKYMTAPYIVESDFKKVLVANHGLSETSVDVIERVFEHLQNSSIVSVYQDPMDGNSWVGPDEAGKFMRVLSQEGKLTVFKKWIRILDYVALIAMMDIDYTDRSAD